MRTSRPGYYGEFGGRFAPETLMAPLEELEAAWKRWRRDPAFRRELSGLLRDYAGRPTPLTVAENLTREAGGAKIKINFQNGDKVKIKEGPFENFDGVVDDINEQKGIVRVIVTIFGRATPVELQYWQVEAL